MQHVWDYNVEELKKTEKGRLLMLQRQIEYGVSEGERIDLQEVKRNWDKLTLGPRRKRLFKLLIWNN